MLKGNVFRRDFASREGDGAAGTVSDLDFLAEVAGEVPNAGLMGPLAPLRRAAKEGESAAQ